MPASSKSCAVGCSSEARVPGSTPRCLRPATTKLLGDLAADRPSRVALDRNARRGCGVRRAAGHRIGAGCRRRRARARAQRQWDAARRACGDKWQEQHERALSSPHGSWSGPGPPRPQRKRSGAPGAPGLGGDLTFFQIPRTAGMSLPNRSDLQRSSPTLHHPRSSTRAWHTRWRLLKQPTQRLLRLPLWPPSGGSSGGSSGSPARDRSCAVP